CDDNGVASFDLVRHHRANESIFLYAFDLIELNGDDLRRDPLEVRKATLASIVAKASAGIRFNEHIEGDGPTVFAHACKLGLEGIVSKRKDSTYRSGRSGKTPLSGSRQTETARLPPDKGARFQASPAADRPGGRGAPGRAPPARERGGRHDLYPPRARARRTQVAFGRRVAASRL